MNHTYAAASDAQCAGPAYGGAINPTPAAPRPVAEGGVFSNLGRTDGLIDSLHTMISRLEGELAPVLESESEKAGADRIVRGSASCGLAMQIDGQNERFISALSRLDRILSRIRL